MCGDRETHGRKITYTCDPATATTNNAPQIATPHTKFRHKRTQDIKCMTKQSVFIDSDSSNNNYSNNSIDAGALECDCNTQAHAYTDRVQYMPRRKTEKIQKCRYTSPTTMHTCKHRHTQILVRAKTLPDTREECKNSSTA